MRAVKKKEARGSLRWIREYVNDYLTLLDDAVRDACRLGPARKIEWVSPLAGDEFAEYGDAAFLEKLGVDLPEVSLKSFWPNRGPQWDALARTDRGELLLIEAKANVPEIVSPGTGASAESRSLIESSLAATKDYLGVDESIPWSGRLYQYANRMAHLYLLRVLNSLPAYTVFVYFIGDEDVSGPKSVEEWKAATTVAKGVGPKQPIETQQICRRCVPGCKECGCGPITGASSLRPALRARALCVIT